MTEAAPDFLTVEDLLEIAAGVVGEVAVRDLDFSVDAAEELVLAVARGDVEVDEIAAVLDRHLR